MNIETEKLMLQVGIMADELYEEKNYTDLKAGGIKAFYPINPDGTADESRDPVFVAITNIDAGVGQLVPVHAKMEDCKTLEQALVDYKVSLEDTINDMIEAAQQREMEEMAEKGRIITVDEFAQGK